MGGAADPEGGGSSKDPEEMFCLKWNDYQENVVATLSELRQEEDFFDVTLAVDGDQVRAHKLVLSACSAFFRRLLRRNPGPNPVIVLWDVAFSDLTNIVDFMYNGEVKVRQANIQSFLAVAEKFRVRGLCQNESSSSNNGHSGRGSPDNSRDRASPGVEATSGKSGSRGGAGGGSSKRKQDLSPRSDPTESADGCRRGPKKARDDDDSPLTPDVSIREESQYSNASRGPAAVGADHHRTASSDFADWPAEGDPAAAAAAVAAAAASYDDRNPGLQAALMGMGMSSLLDPSAAKEFLRRATALGFNSAAMAAAAAGGTPPSHKPSGGGGNGGGSDRGDRNLDHSAGSPHANDPSGLRRPRSVYNSSQVAQLEAYFRFNEYIDGERKRRLSQITSIPEHQIKVWFQNRRQKKKREEAEMMSGGGGSGGGGSGPGVSGLQFKEEPGAHMLHSMEEEEEDYPGPSGAGANHDDSGGGGGDEEPETGDPIVGM